MADFLFVYGTLRRGLEPAFLAPHLERVGRVADVSVAGRLYDLGEYPGVQLGSDDGARVLGELLELGADSISLTLLDRYEGQQFRRERCQARCSDGRELDCWIYVFLGIPDESRRIASGDYAAYRMGPSS